MPYPVTHVLLPMLIVETYRRYFAKKKFSKWYVFFAGLMGGAPDFDFFYAWLMTGSFRLEYHRLLSHSLLVSTVLAAIGLGIYALHKNKILKYKGWRVSYMLIFIASLGIALHTIADGFDGLTHWFYPLSWTLNMPNLVLNEFRAAILDGVLLFIWILYDPDLLKDILRILRLKR
ncbi:MAG: metal-dependent hydrolase [Candidatus Woesearchaeota archaeon]